MDRQVRAILIAFGIILSIVVLWYLRSVIAYVLIAAVLSILGRPIMHFLERKKLGKRDFPSSIAAVITLVVLIALMLGFVGIFIPLVQDQANHLAQIEQSQFEAALEEPINDLGSWMDDQGMIPEDQTKEGFMQEKSQALLGYIKISDIFNFFLAQIGNVMIGVMSILFITFFFLKDRSMIFRTIYSLTPEKSRGRMHEVLKNTKRTLTRYFMGVCLQITLITIIVAIGLTILDIRHALLIGFLAGVVNVIPYLGPIIGAFFGLLIGITGHLDLDFYNETVPLLIRIACVFAFVQLLDNFVFQPYIFSNSVNAHPLEIFLVILSAGTLAGIPGMVLAVPTYSFLRIVAKEFYSQFTLVQTMTKGMDEEKDSPMDGIKKKLFKKED